MSDAAGSPAGIDWTRKRFHASAQKTPPRVIVAIPARNEAERIADCLAALSAQQDEGGEALGNSFGALLFVNGSIDRTFEIAAAAELAFPIRIYDAALPTGFNHAGGARRVALDLAADWLEEVDAGAGYMLSTDADSRPAPDWIAQTITAFARGADAVAGRIELDVADEAELSSELRARGALEAVYEELVTEIFARLDPRLHDPWPRHASEPGASFALTLAAYRQIGGAPAIESGEDRALAALIEAHELKLRHEPAVSVVTSGRLIGRARGGVADALSFRTSHPEAECDPYLEPAFSAAFRAFWRGRIRALHALGDMNNAGAWPLFLRIDPRQAETIARATSFEQAWSMIDSSSPALARRGVAPRDLPAQISLARLMLAALRRLHFKAPGAGPIDILSGVVADEAARSLEPRQETR